MSTKAPISYSFNRYPNNNSNGNDNNNNTLIPEHTNYPQINENEPPCEFTNPCTTTTSPTKPTFNKSTTSKHLRKVISHIFGRNKAVTKLVPVSVWVHYCRKHYQRARYRSTQWPFTQAELLLDMLGRMEMWGGAKGFEMVLRRREVERVDGVDGVDDGSGGGRVGTRKSARVSAVKGQEQDGGEDGDGDETVYTSGSSNDNDHDDNPSSSEHTPRRRSTSFRAKNKAKGRRKKPNIEPAPVPDWLRQEVGPNKSFDDIRGIISRLLEYLTVLREEGRKKEIRFPDIEILPEFQGWVFEMEKASVREKRARAAAGSGLKGQVKKGAKRVSGRGAVHKV